MAKTKSPVAPTPVDPAKLPAAERAAFYQTQLQAAKIELKKLNAGLPDTDEGRDIRSHIESNVSDLVRDIQSVNSEKVLRTLTIQIKNGEFHKVGGFLFVKPRSSTSADESESEAA